MRIIVELEVNDLDDVDESHEMGITPAAYERLVSAIAGADFSVGDISEDAS